MTRLVFFKRALAALCVAFLCAPTTAEELFRLDDRNALFGWEAVGRVDIGPDNFCTGVLIAPDLVLTAAHCVHDRQGKQHGGHELLFRAGLRDGQSLAESAVTRVAVLDAYDPFGGMSAANVRSDAALLELSTPVPTGVADPFALFTGPAIGEDVSVVSYGRNREDALSWQRKCGVLGQGNGLISFDCDVTFGSSGAPVFSLTGRRARIVSLVVGGGQSERGETVAYGMELPEVVTALKRQLRAMPGSGSRNTGFRRLRVDEGGRASGAKFARP